MSFPRKLIELLQSGAIRVEEVLWEALPWTRL